VALPPGRGNGAAVSDGFEQPDLAVTDRLAGREIETQGEPHHASNLTGLHS